MEVLRDDFDKYTADARRDIDAELGLQVSALPTPTEQNWIQDKDQVALQKTMDQFSKISQEKTALEDIMNEIEEQVQALNRANKGSGSRT